MALSLSQRTASRRSAQTRRPQPGPVSETCPQRPQRIRRVVPRLLEETSPLYGWDRCVPTPAPRWCRSSHLGPPLGESRPRASPSSGASEQDKRPLCSSCCWPRYAARVMPWGSGLISLYRLSFFMCLPCFSSPYRNGCLNAHSSGLVYVSKHETVHSSHTRCSRGLGCDGYGSLLSSPEAHFKISRVSG